MAFNATNPVLVGGATKKDHYDRVFDNTLALRTGEMALTGQVVDDFLFASSTTQLSRRGMADVVLLHQVFGD